MLFGRTGYEMSATTKQEYRNLIENENEGSQHSLLAGASDTRDEDSDEDMEKIFHQDPDIFLLNNLLMSVQFFENYERDIRLLREHWFKDTALPAHHKTCFHADSLFRLSAANVKFSPRHGMYKNSETSLHPLRIYVMSDNVEAAFDPSSLRQTRNTTCPQYQFTVKTTENQGCVQLIENKTIRERPKAPTSGTDFPTFRESIISSAKTEQQQQSWRKFNVEAKPARRLTKMERLIGSQNNPKPAERRSSWKFFAGTIDAVIPHGDFYKFTSPEGRVKPVSLQEFRMNSGPASTCDIPLSCFQRQDIKQPFNANRRAGILKNGLNGVFRSQYVLNGAAFKGYFCDVLVERLAGALSLDSAAVSNSSVLGEFVMVSQSGMQYGLAPVIPIRDWKSFVVINGRFKSGEDVKEPAWPSRHMQKIINILPCNAVPVGHSAISKENLDYEKEWTLVFPKAEEFLLLHMMHAHVRCYFFALLIYKSFLEMEINVGSFGPRHLLHLLFWRVHKNFLAWPEHRPGETLLIYLKALYKKIQNKHLPDFFVNSRNLFATSLPNDLHKAQALIKKIIENPIPCLIRALRNLRLKSSFYPALDLLKLKNVLSASYEPQLLRKTKKEKKRRILRFEDENDDERRWKKDAFKQIELERKLDEEAPKLSVESVNIEQPLSFDTGNREKCTRVLEIFCLHFLKMRHKSLEFKFSSQALSYLAHSRKLLDLMASNGGNQNDIIALKTQLNKLTDNEITLKQNWPESVHKEQPLPPVRKPLHILKNRGQRNAAEEGKFDIEIQNHTGEKQNAEGNTSEEEEIYESKL